MIDLRSREISKLFPRNITPNQSKDAGMALLLICLIIGYFWEYKFVIPLSIILVLSNMIWPKIFLPFARIWFGVSNVLGIVMSKVILGVVFFLLVTPMGVVRKLLGKDSMQLKQWKKGTASVFKMRDHTFTPGEIEKPY
jgi:hypothetical protein